MQCAAYLGDNRCCNKIVGDSYHCELHRNKARKLYLKYKKYGDMCDNLDLNMESEENIIKCYCLLNKTFKLREKHRKYAFVDELHDDGHNYQFEKLKILMTKCETILEKLYNIKIVEDIKIVKTDEFIGNNENINIIDKSFDFHKYKQELKTKHEKECNEFIEKCIIENNSYVEEHRKLIICISNSIYNFFLSKERDKIILYFVNLHKFQEIGYHVVDDDKITATSINFIGIMIFELIDKLIDFAVFSNGIQTDKTYNLIIFAKKYKNVNLANYLHDRDIKHIRLVFDKIIFHTKILKILLGPPLTLCYHILKYDTFTDDPCLNFCLFWHDELNRLVVTGNKLTCHVRKINAHDI